MAVSKPSMDEVLKYAKPIIFQFINKFAADSPHEHKEEIEQCAYLRIIEAYDRLEEEKGWKSFVYNHSRGAVLDFQKFGVGFHEQRWSILKPEESGARHQSKIHERVFMPIDSAEKDRQNDIDMVLGSCGVFSEQTIERGKIQWDLVARMASVDEVIHAFAKWLRGFKIGEIAACLSVSRTRVTHLLSAFVNRFDDPNEALEPWFLQTAYGFGLCEHLGIQLVDQSKVVGFIIGWNHKPVDLDSLKPIKIPESLQLWLFDMEA